MPLPIRQVDPGNVDDDNDDADDPTAGGHLIQLSELMRVPPVVEQETMLLSFP